MPLTPPPSREMCKRFGMNLRRCRERLGISQEELGFRIGAHPSTVGPFERGKKLPMIERFIRLTGSLEVMPNELVEGIAWTPGEAIVTPGGFDVPDDPAVAAELATLRASTAEQPEGSGVFEVPDDPAFRAELDAARESAYQRGRGRGRG